MRCARPCLSVRHSGPERIRGTRSSGNGRSRLGPSSPIGLERDALLQEDRVAAVAGVAEAVRAQALQRLEQRGRDRARRAVVLEQLVVERRARLVGALGGSAAGLGGHLPLIVARNASRGLSTCGEIEGR